MSSLVRRAISRAFANAALKYYATKFGTPSTMADLDMERLETIWREVIKRVGLENADFEPPSAAWAMCGQLQPACAVLGGIVAQELIKVGLINIVYSLIYCCASFDSNDS